MMIGFKGGRGVGKSTIASHLVEKHGFARAHPFDGGKEASRAYFMYLGASAEVADSMIFGPLKDRPSPLLPLDAQGRHNEPRFFLEKFGAFMGVTMGPDWTIRQEVDRLTSHGFDRIVFESIAFEADTFKQMGGIIIEILPLSPGQTIGVIGIETDAAVQKIIPDHVFQNHFSSNILTDAERDALFGKFDEFMEDAGLISTYEYALEV